jgi:nucleoside-diphosphate-sugar epimerase
MTNVLVSGATGFVGRRLLALLREAGQEVTALTRTHRPIEGARAITADLAQPAGLRGVCKGTASVFHLAGYAHAEDANDDAAAALHRTVTVEGTRALLNEAVQAGVQRFVFVSSVKAMGEGGEECLGEDAPAQPTTAYGRAKREAEGLVLDAGVKHGMHVAVLRLPLVYGPGNKGNLARMIAAIDRGRFPPLPEVRNKRSMVHVEDVVQALSIAAENPAANGQVFVVTDGRTYSTREIYEAVCRALGRKPPGWSVPGWMLRLGAGAGDVLAGITGRSMPLTTSALDKLLGSAWYSSEKIRRELGFVSRHTFFDAIPEMIDEYRKNNKG